MNDDIYCRQKPELDFSKPIQTREGREVRILCTDAPGSHPVVGYIRDSRCRNSDEADIYTWSKNGVWARTDCRTVMDLENPPESIQKRTFWVNLYAESSASVLHNSKAEADRGSNDRRIACVPITIEFRPGDGLTK